MKERLDVVFFRWRHFLCKMNLSGLGKCPEGIWVGMRVEGSQEVSCTL